MIKDSAKTILCYGDSNTWGKIPGSENGRHPRSVRWTGILQNLLGDDFEIVSEGLCGRTLVALDPEKQHRTGFHDLHACLESADPLDLVIVMLGTNDTKLKYGLSASEIAEDLEEVIALIKHEKINLSKVPELLIVCPPAPAVSLDEDREADTKNSVELFKELPGLYEEVATRYGVHFLDAGKVATSDAIDGYHLNAEAHTSLARALEEKIKSIL
jgi:lysophospholipase L1-like esterase